MPSSSVIGSVTKMQLTGRPFPPPVWQRRCWNSSIAIDIIDATFPHAKRKDAAMDWNPIEGICVSKLRRDGVISPRAVSPKSSVHQKVRCVRRKQREASLAEIWDVVSFWTKLFAFRWLLIVQVAGLMMGRSLSGAFSISPVSGARCSPPVSRARRKPGERKFVRGCRRRPDFSVAARS